MITRRLLRPARGLLAASHPAPAARSSCNAWTAAAALPPRPHLLQRRPLHGLTADLDPEVNEHLADLNPVEVAGLNSGYGAYFAAHGVPGLLSAKGFKNAWTDHQGMVLAKLNELIAGDIMEHMTPKDIAIMYARDPQNAAMFNYASMAANNHFFFRALSTLPTKIDDMPMLRDSLIRAFGSMETLRTTMIDSAMGMFGPGFTWLVWADAPNSAASQMARLQHSPDGAPPESGWRILNTYLAGSPFGDAGYRRQTTNMSMARVGAFGEAAAPRPGFELGPGAATVTPVLCVNTWEHVWLEDYSVLGKRKYLSNWWDHIDWAQVEHNSYGLKLQPISRGSFARK